HVGRRAKPEQEPPRGNEGTMAVGIHHPRDADDRGERKESPIRALAERAGEHIAQPGAGDAEMNQQEVGACSDQIRHVWPLVFVATPNVTQRSAINCTDAPKCRGANYSYMYFQH